MAESPVYIVGVRINELPAMPELEREISIPVQLNGLAGHITVGQILDAVVGGEDLALLLQAAFAQWVANLPTELPSEPGLAWNNGGMMSIS